MNTKNEDKSDSREEPSSAEEKIVMVTKVGDIVTDKDSIGNDEIIDMKDGQIRNSVQNKALNFVPVEISDDGEQNNTDINEQPNGNLTVENKDDNPETLKKEKSGDINVNSNVPPADQDELSSQSENDFVNVAYENAPNDQKVVGIANQKNNPNFDGSTSIGTEENDEPNNSTNRRQSENVENRRDLTIQLHRSEEDDEDEMNVRKKRELKSKGDVNSDSKFDHVLSSQDTRSQESDMREEFDKFTRTPPISRSDQNEKFVSTSLSARNQNITDDEFDEFARTPLISKSGHNTRSQRESDLIDEEYEKVVRTPPSGHYTRSQKESYRTEEEFDEFIRAPVPKSEHDTRNQKRSDMTDEEFENVARTPILKSGRDTRSQKESDRTEEEFD
ncbi:hypothetical protein RhiirA1_407276, partial [Rhizophagus irregularis]